MTSEIKLPSPAQEEDDEEACWAKFDPMKDDFENPLENSFKFNSVGGLLPKKYLTCNKLNSQPSSTDIKLFVSKIPLSVTERGLRNIFSPYGNVLFISIVKNTKNDRRRTFNFGFVSYANILEADRAIQNLNSSPPYYLNVDFDISEEERRERDLIENFSQTLDRITSLDDPDQSQLEEDYSIKENISYSPGLPLENIDLSSLLSSVDALLPHHLYERQQHCEELFEPYLMWGDNAKDVAHRIALRHYICKENLVDVAQDIYNEPVVTDKTNTGNPVTEKFPSKKTFGVKGNRSIQACAYCHRRVFNSSLICRCGVVYDDIQCQHRHWPQHKSVCKTQSFILTNQHTRDGVDEEYRTNDNDEFNEVVQGFKKFYSSCGSVLDRKDLITTGVNIIPEIWWDSNSGLVVVANNKLVESLFKILDTLRELPDADESQVKIGQLVGVFLENIDLYVRGIVAVKTRLGLIGVLILEHGSFVLVPSVKVLPGLSLGCYPACNVLCTVLSRDEDFVLQNNRALYKQLKDSNKFRAFTGNYFSCTVELRPYLMPQPEQIPLLCVSVENKARVILTSFYSARAVYIQPIDTNTQIRCTVITSEVLNWCIKNHVPSQWTPKKNQLVGVKLSSEEYRRGQVIGMVALKNSDDTPNSVEKKSYLVSLTDSGINVKVSCENMVPLPHQFRKDPCYCTKVSLKTANQQLDAECFLYLNLMVQNKTPLIVEFLDSEFMTVELTDECGNKVHEHIQSLSTLRWEISQLEVNTDPTKTDEVLTLSTLKVPLYPLSCGDKIHLKLLNIYDVSYASMLVLSREENQHVQSVLAPRMKEYCAQLTMEKYNPSSGVYCLVYCRDLRLWCRAQCEKASDEHGHCYVFLVDYGVHAHIPISDIRPCHAWFTKYHSMAFVAHIPDFEKSEMSSEELMEKYSIHEFTVLHILDCSEQRSSDKVVLAL